MESRFAARRGGDDVERRIPRAQRIYRAIERRCVHVGTRLVGGRDRRAQRWCAIAERAARDSFRRLVAHLARSHMMCG